MKNKMRNIFKKSRLALLTTLFFLFASATFAQVQGPAERLKSVGGSGGYSTSKGGDTSFIGATLSKVVIAFLSLLGIIFIFLIILAGYHYMTARGEEAKVEKALATIRHSVVGLIIILGAYAIWNFIYYYLISGTT
jgi:hypothetical protein